MHSEGKAVTGSMIIEKPKAVYDELLTSVYLLRTGCKIYLLSYNLEYPVI
jgi:hypothetical protein